MVELSGTIVLIFMMCFIPLVFGFFLSVPFSSFLDRMEVRRAERRKDGKFSDDNVSGDVSVGVLCWCGVFVMVIEKIDKFFKWVFFGGSGLSNYLFFMLVVILLVRIFHSLVPVIIFLVILYIYKRHCFVE